MYIIAVFPNLFDIAVPQGTAEPWLGITALVICMSIYHKYRDSEGILITPNNLLGKNCNRSFPVRGLEWAPSIVMGLWTQMMVAVCTKLPLIEFREPRFVVKQGEAGTLFSVQLWLYGRLKAGDREQGILRGKK
jgi:hypothetical protein